MIEYKIAPGDCGIAERQFHVLEALIDLRNISKTKIVTEQDLVDRLYNDMSWFFSRTKEGRIVSHEVIEDVERLQQRGYLFEDTKGSITPTKKAESIYNQIYGIVEP